MLTLWERQMKAVEMLQEALGPSNDPEFGLALRIEDAVYRRQVGWVGHVISDDREYLHRCYERAVRGYSRKIRSLCWNLKDGRNPCLKERVVRGEIPVDALVGMSAHQLFPELRKCRYAEADRGRWWVNPAKKKGSGGIFQCGKCRSQETTWYQLQTRSADEPMTTFITCLECGNRWRE